MHQISYVKLVVENRTKSELLSMSAFCATNSALTCVKLGCSFSYPATITRKHHVPARTVMKQGQKQSKLSPLNRILRFLPFRRKPSQEAVPVDDTPEPTRYDWAVLVEEFEIRSRAKQRATKPPPPGVELKDEIRYKKLMFLPAVEIAAMAALTQLMWNFGRLFRLDPLFLTFYPLPMFYVCLRWGVKKGDAVLMVSLFHILMLMGPLFSVLYLLNTGIMALVMSRALYRQWGTPAVVATGGLAKGVGLGLQFTLMSGVIKENAWSFIGYQLQDFIQKIVGMIWWITRRTGVAPSPTLFQIQCVVGAVLLFHSMLHVLCTYLSACMILDRVADSGVEFERRIRLPGALEYAKKKLIETERSRTY